MHLPSIIFYPYDSYLLGYYSYVYRISKSYNSLEEQQLSF